MRYHRSAMHAERQIVSSILDTECVLVSHHIDF